MTTPAFFVQNNYVERLTVPVALHARAAGVALLDRSTDGAFDPDDCGIEWSEFGPVVPYGSVQFARKLRRSLALGRFVHYDAEAFTYSAWLERGAENMLNAGSHLVDADAVALLLKSGALHARPEFVDKAFHARVFDAEAWQTVLKERVLPNDLKVRLSAPQQLGREWRCWVIGGEVVEISKYRDSGQKAVAPESDANIWSAARAQAAGWLPAACVVMDIAETAQGIRKVEFNPIHSSGWYAANVGHVLDRWLAWELTSSPRLKPGDSYS